MDVFPLLLLAGGASTRMGFPKGLIELDRGQPLLIHQLEVFENAGGQSACVVLGSHAASYEPLLERYLQRTKMQISTRINTEPHRGMFSSVQLGIDCLQQAPGLYLLPLDNPIKLSQTYRHLQNALDPKTEVCLAYSRGQKRHPLFIKQSLFNAVLAQSQTARLDHFLRSINSDKKQTIEISDPWITFNLNTPEDLAQFTTNQNHDDGSDQ